MKHISKFISVLISMILIVSAFSGLCVNAAATAQSTPYFNDFDTEGYKPLESDGFTVTGLAEGATVAVSDGKLAVSGIADVTNPDGTTTNGLVQNQFAELSVNPVSTGFIVIEAELHVTNTTSVNPNFNASNGLINVLDSNGNMVANTYLSGRGATRLTSNGGAVDVTSTWSGTARSWGHEASTYGIKYEIDFSTRKWKGYRASGGVTGTYMQYTTTDGVNEFSFANANATDIAKIQFLLGVNGMSVDKIKVYSIVEAVQTESGYNMTVGSTQQAGISYTPSTETMGDMVWTSTNTNVATVSNTGLISAVGYGKSVISAKSAFYGIDFEYAVCVDSSTVTAQALPYINYFDDETKFPAGYRPMKKDGFTTSNMVSGAYIESDGTRLVMHSDSEMGSTGMGRIELEFSPISSGIYAVELNYGNVSGEVDATAGDQGMFGIYSSDGTRVADIRAAGRGPNGDQMLVNGQWQNVVDNNNWMYGGTIRYEIDFTSKTYRIYQQGRLLSDTSTGQTDFAFTGNNISKLIFVLSNDGDFVDNIKVMKCVSATQLKTEYKLQPGERTALTSDGMKITAGSVRDFTFVSSNPSVATVASNGRVLAVDYGTAIITVTNEINRIRFVFVVTVEAPATEITIDQSDRVIYTGESFRLTYTVPVSQDEGTVTWSSSNKNVATVGADGVINGISSGTAVITVTSENGVSADYVIEVVDFDDSAPAIEINNADFEKSLSRWVYDSYNTAKAVWSSGGANNSSGCAKFTEQSYISQSFTNPEPGAIYTISFMLKIVSLEEDSYASVEVESYGYDNVAGASYSKVTNGWEKKYIEFVAPKGCVGPVILLRFDGNGEAYFDEVRITRQKDATEVRLFSDGLALNSLVKNAPLTTAEVYYVPKTSGTSEIISAVYENGEYKTKTSKPVSSDNGIQRIDDLIDIDALNENSTVSIMNWNATEEMKALDTKKTFLEKTQRSDVYNFFEINRMRGVYGGIGDIYNPEIKKLITEKGINTLILNIIGTYHNGDVCRDMYALSKVMDDAQALSEETGVKIIPKISYGANATVSNTAYGEFHSGGIMKNGAGVVVASSNAPCPRSREYWKKQVTDVLSTVALHKGIYGGVVDLEMYSSYRTSYGDTCKCDTCAADFDSAYGTKVAQQEITTRHKYLADNNMLTTYNAWQKNEIIDITDEVREAIQTVNPDFVLGYMPQLEWIAGITEGLGTHKMPVMVFNEQEYKGNLGAMYMNQGRIKYNDLPAVYATGLWSTKNTGTYSYLASDVFASKAVEAAENSMGYWIYSSLYLVGTGNTAEENAAYIAAIKSANDTINTKYGL
ncbi:MAG: Ig-like domain-containing protein [Eubacteriales bacterium]|nr:Ig-like domain-containing protein [Eubacteriales bacterium]